MPPSAFGRRDRMVRFRRFAWECVPEDTKRKVRVDNEAQRTVNGLEFCLYAM
jgi:hypothetical protein